MLTFTTVAPTAGAVAVQASKDCQHLFINRIVMVMMLMIIRNICAVTGGPGQRTSTSGNADSNGACNLNHGKCNILGCFLALKFMHN